MKANGLLTAKYQLMRMFVRLFLVAIIPNSNSF